MALKVEFETQGNWLFKHRSILPLGILLIAIVALIQTNVRDGILTVCTPYYEIFCLLVSLAGLGIRIYTVGFSQPNTSGSNTSAGQVADSLNTTGIYSIVRHPLYLVNSLMWLGPALFTANDWFIVAFILFYWLYYERIMFAEEPFLERKFGAEYRLWAIDVPAFIPNPQRFRHPQIPFTFKKVIQKEKSGLLAMFLVFAFFDVADEWFRAHTHYNQLFIYGAIIALLINAVINIMRSRTTVFNY